MLCAVTHDVTSKPLPPAEPKRARAVVRKTKCPGLTRAHGAIVGCRGVVARGPERVAGWVPRKISSRADPTEGHEPCIFADVFPLVAFDSHS